MDPYVYLTSIVLNSCANAEPKTIESPSAGDVQATLLGAAMSTRVVHTKLTPTIRKEEEGWVRMRPKKNAMTSIAAHNFPPADLPVPDSDAWGGSVNPGTNQANSGYGV